MKKKKRKQIKVILKRAEGISEEEVQRRWDKIFDILFSEVEKNRRGVSRKVVIDM